MLNTVNCWNANAKAMPISSQAIRELVEGSETRSWSPERTVKTHERSALSLRGEDIVPSSEETLSAGIKSLAIRSCYVSNFGELDVILDRNQDDAMYLLDFNYLATPVLRPTRDWPIAKAGDSDVRQILRESTFAVLNTKAHAAIDNVPASLT